MGRILITGQNQWSERELATSTLIGRHWSCDVQLRSDDVPLRWLELRWLDNCWGWRALSREGDTLGAGSWLRPGWRRLALSKKGKTQLRLRSVVALELIEDGPPQPYAVDLQNGRVLRRMALEERLQAAGFKQWRSPVGEPLQDGAVIILDGHPVRLHLPQRAPQAALKVLSILHPDALLKLKPDSLSGALEIAPTRIDLQREMVRGLLPYAEARLQDGRQDGGWLTRDEAFSRWLELGGNPDSDARRMGWVRGKIRNHLARSGLASLDRLFESQRMGQWYGTRLGLQLEQIYLS